MSELGFEVTGRQQVPVEVYDSSFVPVRRTLSSDRIAVGPGMYFVIGRLPDGSELHTTVKVESSELAWARLGPPAVEDDLDLDDLDLDDLDLDDLDDLDLDDVSDIEIERLDLFDEPDLDLEDVERYLEEGEAEARAEPGETRRAPRRPDGKRAKRPPAAGVRPYARGAAGDWGPTHERVAVHGEIHLGSMTPSLGAALELRQLDGATAWVRIPWQAARHLAVAPRTGRDGRVRVAAQLEHPVARALLDYVDAGLLADAALLAGSPEVTAERLLRDKRMDPVAAAAAAFVLLRLGDLDRLHTWTVNLQRFFEWLPDGLVACAEHAAREGRHDEALEHLRGLPGRGLPILSMGLAYAVDRLRTYVRVAPRDEALRGQLNELARYALATDFAQPVTTFSGESPDSPWPFARPPVKE